LWRWHRFSASAIAVVTPVSKALIADLSSAPRLSAAMGVFWNNLGYRRSAADNPGYSSSAWVGPRFFDTLTLVTVAVTLGVVLLVRGQKSPRPPLPSTRRKTVLNWMGPNGCELSGEQCVRLLVIEDEDRLSGILKSKLGDVGFTVDVAGSAADATAALELINYDAAVLDLGLPDGDGLAVLAVARRLGKALPILILTARDAVEDRVAGLNAGADDYLTKPFAMTELIARIKALLRRPGGVLGLTLEAGNVRLDTVGLELTVAGAPVRLSRRELAILEQMMRRFGRSVPKTVLEEKLYGIDEEPDSNPIPVHVHHLRRQLEAANASLTIHTIRGVGYILAETKA
jgi:DNA-binding response OmpR family regulator